MGRTCTVCGAKQKNNVDLSFHSFPADDARRVQWLEACKLDKETVVKNVFVCSKHFLIDDYDSQHWPARRLLKTAVPAPSSDYYKANEHGTDVSSNASMSIQAHEASTSTRTTLSTPSPRCVGDLKPEHVETPKKSKRQSNTVSDKVEEKNKKIKYLQKEKVRLEARIESLKELLDHLKENNLSAEATTNILAYHTGLKL